MSIPSFTPRPDDLLAHAPSRHVKPSDRPRRAAIRLFLLGHAIDADDFVALTREVGLRRWLWRVQGGLGRDRRVSAKIIVPWLDIWCWAHCSGADPAEALAGALALAIASPPGPEPADEAEWPREPAWALIA